jgi:Domain of unknown function (DUF4878)
MKYILLSFCVLSIFSCNWLKPRKTPKTPEEVAVAFTKAVSNMNFDEAALYCDSATQNIIKMVSSMATSMPEDKWKQGRENAKFIQSATCSINGDIATCQVCCDGKGDSKPERIMLRLQPNGQWLVFIDKGAKENSPSE